MAKQQRGEGAGTNPPFTTSGGSSASTSGDCRVTQRHLLNWATSGNSAATQGVKLAQGGGGEGGCTWRKAREEAGGERSRNAGQRAGSKSMLGTTERKVEIFTLCHSNNGHSDQFVKITEAQNCPNCYHELSQRAAWDPSGCHGGGRADVSSFWTGEGLPLFGWDTGINDL